MGNYHDLTDDETDSRRDNHDKTGEWTVDKAEQRKRDQIEQVKQQAKQGVDKD